MPKAKRIAKKHLHDWVGAGDERQCSRCEIGLLENIREGVKGLPKPGKMVEKRIAPGA